MHTFACRARLSRQALHSYGKLIIQLHPWCRVRLMCVNTTKLELTIVIITLPQEDNLFWSGRKASRPAKLYESQRIPKTTVIFSENTGCTLALTRRIQPCNKTDNIISSRIRIMLHGNSEYRLQTEAITIVHGICKQRAAY